MYISARTEERVSDQLQPILGSALRNELGRRPFAALLSPERGQMMDNIQNALNRVARQYGAEIVDVRIKRADLPDGTPLEFRLSSGCAPRASRRRARSEAQGYKQAQIIRAEADAEAAAHLCRRLQPGSGFLRFLPGDAVLRDRASSERRPAESPRGRSSIILSPNNEYLRQFRGNR